MENKKGQGLTLRTITIATLMVIVLLVLSTLFYYFVVRPSRQTAAELSCPRGFMLGPQECSELGGEPGLALPGLRSGGLVCCLFDSCPEGYDCKNLDEDDGVDQCAGFAKLCNLKDKKDTRQCCLKEGEEVTPGDGAQTSPKPSLEESKDLITDYQEQLCESNQVLVVGSPHGFSSCTSVSQPPFTYFCCPKSSACPGNKILIPNIDYQKHEDDCPQEPTHSASHNQVTYYYYCCD